MFAEPINPNLTKKKKVLYRPSVFVVWDVQNNPEALSCIEAWGRVSQKKEEEFTWFYNTTTLGSFYDPSADQRTVITPGGMERQV